MRQGGTKVRVSQGIITKRNKQGIVELKLWGEQQLQKNDSNFRHIMARNVR